MESAPFTIETSLFHKKNMKLAPPTGCLEEPYEAGLAE